MKLYQKDLSDLLISKPKCWYNVLHSRYKYIYDDVILNTPKIFENTNISTKVFCYLNDVVDYPKCVICNNIIKDLNADVKFGFKKTCCKKCSNQYKHNRTEEACLKKYGVKNIYSLKSFIEKTANTKLQRYGSETYCNHEKAKQTSLQKYGVDNPAKSDKIKDKIKNTCLEKYGVEYSFQAQQTKDKIIQTSLDKYGTINPGCSEQSLKKIKDTFNQRYGNDISSPGDLLKQDKYRLKNEQTCLKRYGVKHVSQNDVFKQKTKDTCLRKYGCSNRSTYESYQLMMSNEYDVPIFSLEEFDKIGSKHTLLFKCKKCGKQFESYHSDGMHKHCPECYPIKENCGKSFAELEILEFLKTIIDNEVISGDRNIIKPFEIDIYIPSRKIGIEYDGLYYHMHGSKPDDYHVKKTTECEKHGIQLIHIFENEWIFKRDIVKSRLKNIFGIYDNVVFARKCQIREIDTKTSNEFQDKNHIQGAVNSKVNLGLFYNNQLISLMTFSKPRFDKKHEWELVRFCNKLGYHIPGAAGKLLKHFERNYKPKTLVSYADRRWSKGNLYEKLNFKLKNTSSPNYWYFKTNVLESRVKFQKHKLKNILEKFDESKSEKDNMLENGYKFIYDCGNLVYVKTYNERAIQNEIT